jgi:tRNA threonylcarbamoyladenosine biosynthesis protein TsaB
MDGVTLVIDAATYDGSVAVLLDGEVMAARSVAMRGITEERLMPAVADALLATGIRPGEVARVARVVCGAGPGSFTSLRIAAGIAKGICVGAGIPLYAISSLALAVPALGMGRHLVTLDALRGDRYVGVYDWDGTHLRTLLPDARLPNGDVAALAVEYAATVSEAVPHAVNAAVLLPGIVAADAVDRQAWEPAYGRLAEAQVKWEATHQRPLVG